MLCLCSFLALGERCSGGLKDGDGKVITDDIHAVPTMGFRTNRYLPGSDDTKRH